MSDLVIITLINTVPITLGILISWWNGRKLNTIHQLTKSFATNQANVIERKSAKNSNQRQEISDLKCETKGKT